MMAKYFGYHPIALAVLMSTALASVAVAQQDADLPTPLQSTTGQASYGIGRGIGMNLARGGLDAELLDMNALAEGIRDAMTGVDSKVTDEQFQAAMQQFQQLAQQKMQQKMEALSKKNLAEGPAFVAKYKTLDGVQTTPSGILYRVDKEGTGPSPKATDTVRTHYRGRLVDGKEFDSSYRRNEPAVFPLNGVIPGWTEVLQMMKVGGKRQVVIPPNLAYGEQGSMPAIGPNAYLVFDIELLGIEEPQDGAAPQQ